MSDAFVVIGKIFGERGKMFADLPTFFYAFSMILIMFFKDLRDEYFPQLFKAFDSKKVVVRFVSYLFIMICILMFGVLDSSQFIYFQF